MMLLWDHKRELKLEERYVNGIDGIKKKEIQMKLKK